jgi:hypothetical protein
MHYLFVGLKFIGLFILRTIQTTLTLGLFWRFHWITKLTRATDARRIGLLGLSYVDAGSKRLVVGHMLTKTRVALNQIVAVDRGYFPIGSVQIDTTGRRRVFMPSWSPRKTALYIEANAVAFGANL